MERKQPELAILMAVYEPNMAWLKEQLQSLNNQTYSNLKLYIRDDCSPTVPYEQIQDCVRACITAFPYEISRNEKNLGSNLTFQKLTQEAQGEYFAYCDQDDVWLPEKLTVLEEAISQSGAQLVCSDTYIIDGDGIQTADSITKVRRHHVFHSGEGLAEGLLFHNFVTGCTMLVRAQQAKAAVPFCPYMVHDHYLALWCAERGSILSLPQKLIRYRIHGGNQTGLLAGVTDKESYGRIRIDGMLHRLLWLKEQFPCGSELKEALEQSVAWAEARQSNWKSGSGKMTIWRYRKFSKIPSVFELFAAYLPERIFRQFVCLGKKNII